MSNIALTYGSLDDISIDGSTNVAPRYWYSSLMNLVKTTDDEYILDYFDSRYVEPIKNAVSARTIINDGATPLTTICYYLYGNTTLYKFLMSFNGVIHALELLPGALLQIPSITTINNEIKTVSNNNRKGQMVSV